ncbi:cellulase family glycosylhydrolase [Cellvibrio japonicus]|uniref:Mannan endo-1,4-beta-mannosidase n=2 Tax=Cellvibrio japonicus TaxID=155077 RepID=MAN5_CELJU|nr:cellulase family glycosylhydrolase [Cellvibrio japonicus]B3PF24.1 RecName: Full=Mannan endo-1,4-beta-mannosidase; AltName: Full=Mannanase 5A; Short=Man5A; AltName: Full=Mannanase A; Short=ManA [Cellvibrio japonicus Ueda107]AAO31759.1 endo-b1,4-mannanase 5A [Cellvibrio japonicus]ACE84673.1 endo- 1,4-beta-mannanase man5A [Cellvibrio japonicus Ueda107]QEI13583.1 cellulase family glycosylhydrolase [Cellvibrio japonicus]QEI17157.1 cellulase family glycosylhydrolase [Cellvibrio japonicus]QEI2073
MSLFTPLSETNVRSHTNTSSVFCRRIKTLVAGLTALGLMLAAVSASAGFYVSGKQLREGNGNNFIMRGVNLPHAWFPDRTNQALADISATGANSVRVVLSNGRLWSRTPESQVASIISQAKARQLITVLEVHDTTGYGEQTAATLSEAVDYWIAIRNALIGQEDYVIINIGNEPFGNGQSASTWLNLHRDAINRLRNAGFTHTLMVDAANWGQDWENIMRNNASSLFNSDPRRNVIFSVHMYEVYPNDTAVNNYMSAFNSMNLPLVVGEFAANHFGSYVDAGSIMARAQQYGFGYLGWSWSGNSSNLSALDVVTNFNAGSLTTWGNLLINNTNGIRNTSRKATIFGGSGSSSSSAGSCGTAPNGYPYCCNASSATGNGWGWENNRSCVVATTSTSCNWYGTSYPICVNTSSGWGWENNRSCIAASTCAAQ